jgi:hypothetical protein
MKHIKPYKIFESTSPNFPTTREGVIEVCRKYKIENYTINDDLSIDVNGDVELDSKNLKYLPLKFNYVSGDFYCLDNNLESLEGSPQTVGGGFLCAYNKLKTLEDSPQTVDGNFYCGDNELTDLEHFPEVNGIIDIEENKVNLLVYTFIKNADSFMIEDFNDYEIVRNRDTVMLDRLKTFIEGFDLEMPDLEEIKKEYKIIE